MALDTCPICTRDRLFPYASKHGIDFVKCLDCGYVVADPMPSQQELARLYDEAHFKSSYHPDEAQDTTLLQQRQVQYHLDRDHLMQHAPAGRLLDFGCGNGQFLRTFPDDYTKWGYELNRVTTAWIREQGGFTVVDTQEGLEGFDPGFFDVVSMRGVIEHLPEPEPVVELLAGKLRVGGTFYLCATPNMDSPCALIYEASWSQFSPPYHLHQFSPRTLAVLFARHGLALQEYTLPYLGTPYEKAAEDGPHFVRDANVWLDGGAPERSAPYPGTMMSVVFRKVA